MAVKEKSRARIPSELEPRISERATFIERRYRVPDCVRKSMGDNARAGREAARLADAKKK